MNQQQQIEMQQRNPDIFEAISFGQHISREMKMITFMLSFLFFIGITFIIRFTHIQGESKFLMLSFEIITVIMALATLIQIVMWVMEGQKQKKN